MSTARLRRKSFNRPDETRPVGDGRIEVVELGDIVLGRAVYQPGWRWSRDMKPLVGTESCQFHHVGVVLSGRLHVEMEDGLSLEIGPLDAFEIPPGHDAWVVGDEPWVSIDSVGRRHFGRRPDVSVVRFLATILFVDIVESTQLAVRLGDRAWAALLADHNARARELVDRFRGREIGTIGDGFVAIFDSPARAVHCALGLVASSREAGYGVRVGLHTGEVEQAGEDVRGVAVHVAARVAAEADTKEVFVSSTTRALLAGAGFAFESRGTRRLKGLDDPESLYAVRHAPSG
jgi:class 3 adenylate cyclase